MKANMQSSPEASAVLGDATLEFVCSEIWGGNRPIDREVQAPGMRGRLFSRPCDGGSGGDVHYLSVCGSGLLSRLCVADVAGHGEAVSTVSRQIHGLLRKFMNNLDQRRVLAELNRTLESADEPILTTAAAFSYYPPSRTLSYSYAGHPPALYFNRSLMRWSVLELPPTGGRGLFNVPLSVDSKAGFTRGKHHVEMGDRLLVLTDGVLEAPAPGGELFGADRLVALLSRYCAESPSQLAEHIIAALISFTSDESLHHDDVTFMLVEFEPGPAGPAIWHAVRNRLLRPRGNAQALEAIGAI